MVFKFSGFTAWHIFAKFYLPLAYLFLPIAAHNFGIEVHVLLQIEYFAHFVEICPDVRCEREESWPVRVQRELIGVGMRGDVTV